MNKIIFSLSTLLICGSAFSTTDREIRKHLEFLYDNYAINYTQLAENDTSLLEIIDRDINIMENHITRLQNKIDQKKGFWANQIIPCTKTISALSFGGISIFFGYLCVDSLLNNYLVHRIPFACGISSISGIIALKAAISRYKHFSIIAQSINKWKAQIIKNNAIIATLKELKHQF